MIINRTVNNFQAAIFSPRGHLGAAAILIAGACLFCFVNFSSGAPRPFAQADDFPRGAVVYAQAADLPALLKLWDESPAREKYLSSRNFAAFQNRHLALKLAARWQEFNDAAGFEFDAAAFAGASETRAAVAIYDIGKLEFVFIAPLDSERFAGTIFLQNSGGFEEKSLPGGDVFYSCEVAADRGRQRQKIVFANAGGRFVLATSENLLLRALANIGGKTRGDRLADEPDFARLAARIEPHLASVWVNQARLNDDWYFKKYWLMRNVADLRMIRAGIFDFELREDRIVERREFLSDERAAPIDAVDNAAELLKFLPTDAPFFKIERVETDAAATVRDALFDPAPARATTRRERRRWESSNSDFLADGGEWHGDSDYEREIDDAEAEFAADDAKNFAGDDLESVLAAAQPVAAARTTVPQMLENPLFVEFRRLAVLELRRPANLNREKLENAISQIVSQRLAARGARLELRWQTSGRANSARRELELPALGWRLGYAARGDKLIFSNSAELLAAALDEPNGAPDFRSPFAFDELIVARLDRRAAAFDDVMKKIMAGDDGQPLKTVGAGNSLMGEIGSLLDAASDVRQIEIRRKRTQNFLREELSFIFNPRTQ